MGLASLPSASEGMLCLILMNTALSINLVKGIFRSILKVVGINLSESQPASYSPPYPHYIPPQVVSTESIDVHFSPPLSYVEEFRSQNPAIKFETLCHCKHAENDCSVCLTEFEPESEINNLSCGHLFHKVCLEKWLDYLNLTCPLCRTPLLPEFEDDPSCFW
ncbi:RING-H2 finger protein [Melia azedarach]|uniref:RING-H2 finger protein n=1 Tax=Melia azedarach TaxID=155640 RepID=A0ACC1Z4H4_MELAZ|nr:RING-H2 finger protein [Melia azedarach]